MWRLYGFELVGEFWSERVGDLCQHSSSLIAKEHVLDECPLECVAGPIALRLDAVAPVRAAHKYGYDVAASLGPHFKALIERGFVQFKMPPLKR